MRRYFIVADVHGFYDELKTALTAAGFDRDNPNHIFVSLGDLLDRGDQPLECLTFVNSLPKERKILVRGNHEDLMDQMLARSFPLGHDRHNCTDKTVSDLYDAFHEGEEGVETHIFDKIDWFKKECSIYKTYEESLCNYGMVGNCIFVHGWFPYVESAEHLIDVDHWRWKDARWKNGMDEWYYDGPIHMTDEPDSPIATVFCGHIHASYGNARFHKDGIEFAKTEDEKIYENFNPFIDRGIVCLDTCTVYTRKVNCYVIDEKDMGV